VLPAAELKARYTPLLLITHDFALSRKCRQGRRLFQGKLVEEGACAMVLRNPSHEYTRNLLAAVQERVDVVASAQTRHSSTVTSSSIRPQQRAAASRVDREGR